MTVEQDLLTYSSTRVRVERMESVDVPLASQVGLTLLTAYVEVQKLTGKVED